MSLSAVVLAAGKGSRMKSELPKPLHEVRGRPLLAWVVHALEAAELESIVVVVGHERDMVRAALVQHFSGRQFLFAEQLTQRGTGDAAAIGLAELDVHDGAYDDDDHVLVVPGDTPLLTADTIASLVEAHYEHGAACTMVTSIVEDPSGYGRILHTDSGGVAAIVEDREATPDQRAIREINGGLYCFRRSLLSPALRMISSDNSQGELYLTDVVGVLVGAGHSVKRFQADELEIAGVNDRAQLGAAAERIGRRIADFHMRRGVTIVSPPSTVIDATVSIEADVTLHPATVLQGRTSVATGASIGPHTWLVDAEIGERAVVEASTVRNAAVAADATVGPNAAVEGA